MACPVKLLLSIGLEKVGENNRNSIHKMVNEEILGYVTFVGAALVCYTSFLVRLVGLFSAILGDRGRLLLSTCTIAYHRTLILSVLVATPNSACTTLFFA